MKYIGIIIGLICITQVSYAQRRNKKQKKEVEKKQQASTSDTALPPRTVIVTSEFAPALKQTSKINFSGTTPPPDATRPSLSYDIPVQNLSFAYQSPELKALAENIDTGVHWNNTSFVKLGYGNYTTPYLQAGLSFGDGVNSVININGKFVSSNGKLEYQNYSKLRLDALGIFSSANNKNEWNANVYVDNSSQYLYGFQPDSLKFNKSDLKQNFTGFGGKIAVRNKQENAFGINYNPFVAIDIFGDNHDGRENTLSFDLPASKSITKNFDVNLGIAGIINSYKTDTTDISNTIYYVTPSVTYKSTNLKITAGFTPSWSNSDFSLLPNFTADIKLNNEKFILQGGWIGYYNKNTYQALAAYNPFIAQPTALLNSLVKEQYAGFKGSLGDHFTYNARVSFLKITNQPLFVNDTITGKSFDIVYEPSLNDLKIHGEAGYTANEQFSALVGITFNQYSNLKQNARAYGLIPVEFTGSLRYVPIKDLLVKADIFSWRSIQYRTKTFGHETLSPAFDANLGAEFAFMPNWKAWIQFNNVFNNTYQRWNQYPVLGFNMLVGVVYSFGQLKMK